MSAAGETEEPVPWHRVINSQGRISGRGELVRAQRQRELLEREGVEFDGRDRVDLRRFLWSFPDHEWPDEPVDV